MVEAIENLAVGGATDAYIALVRAFPLTHIRDDAHFAAAMAFLWPLLEKPEKSDADKEYIVALTDLLEKYEDATVHIPPVSGVAMVRHLMEDRDLKQKDLVGPVFATQSIASEALSGERTLALAHIKKLAAFFGVSPALFID